MRQVVLTGQKEKCLKIKKIFLTDSATQITELVSDTTDKTKKKVKQSQKPEIPYEMRAVTFYLQCGRENLTRHKNKMSRFTKWNESINYELYRLLKSLQVRLHMH